MELHRALIFTGPYKLCFKNLLFFVLSYDKSYHKEYWLVTPLLLLAKCIIHKCTSGVISHIVLSRKVEKFNNT